MKEYNTMVITINNKEYELDDLHINGNSSEEQEITITSVKADGLMHIYTSDNSYLTKAKKCIRVNPEEWKITNIVFRKDGSISGVMITAPKKYLRFAAIARNLSEEQRAACAERLKRSKQ